MSSQESFLLQRIFIGFIIVEWAFTEYLPDIRKIQYEHHLNRFVIANVEFVVLASNYLTTGGVK